MDIALIENDIVIKNGTPEIDDGLETAVRLSLLTDRRDKSSDDPRGWWADAMEGVPLGSLLWTLEREKASENVIDLARQHCEESLQWLIEDGIAKAVKIDISRTGLYSINIKAEIFRPDGTGTGYNYTYTWDAQAANPTHAR